MIILSGGGPSMSAIYLLRRFALRLAAVRTAAVNFKGHLGIIVRDFYFVGHEVTFATIHTAAMYTHSIANILRTAAAVECR